MKGRITQQSDADDTKQKDFAENTNIEPLRVDLALAKLTGGKYTGLGRKGHAKLSSPAEKNPQFANSIFLKWSMKIYMISNGISKREAVLREEEVVIKDFKLPIECFKLLRQLRKHILKFEEEMQPNNPIVLAEFENSLQLCPRKTKDKTWIALGSQLKTRKIKPGDTIIYPMTIPYFTKDFTELLQKTIKNGK